MVNLNTTYRAHDSAHHAGSSVGGALAESQRNIGALQVQMAADKAIVNRENTDGGQVNPGTGGAIGMVAQAISKYGTGLAGAAAIAVGGPVGVAIGTAALAVDVTKFVAGGKSAEPTGSGNYLAESYAKMTRGGAYKNEKDDPIVAEGYTDSQGGYTAAGGNYSATPPQQPQLAAAQPPASLQRMLGQFDEGEEATARKRLAKSADLLADNTDQLNSTIGYAQKRGMDVNRAVGEGPKPQGMGGGMGPMGPGMGA